MTVTVTDNGVQPASGAATITITLIDPSAVLPSVNVNGLGVTYVKKQQAILVLPNIEVIIPRVTPTLLTIKMASAGKPNKSADRLVTPSIRAIGSSDGIYFEHGQMVLQIQLTSAITASKVEEFLRGIQFSTKSKRLKNPRRIISLALQLSDGLILYAFQWIHRRIGNRESAGLECVAPR